MRSVLPGSGILTRRPLATPTLLALCLLPCPAASVVAWQQVDSAFFESRIRPVLVERCYECHNSADRAEAGLQLDHREGLRRGGDNGPAIVPGEPDQGTLLPAIRHESDSRMPEGGPQLDETVIADFETWIRQGAVDPRDQPPSAEELRESLSWEAVRDRRMDWWSLRPLGRPEVPDVDPKQVGADAPLSSSDRFLAQELLARQLTFAPLADRRTQVTRLAWVLTGLPPTVEELERFAAGDDESQWQASYEAAVEYYLASPAFGERWARHWMDLFRYTDSHGSEGDPTIPFAWRYRDYLIRAFSNDLPLDRLVREHLAGDLLDTPRIDPSSGLDESPIGLGHFRMVQHGFAPVDPQDEQIRFVDNQIDVVSKSLLGMTVSCARCHDHKFDPISQKDFHRWYGIFAQARPALISVPSEQDDSALRAEMLEQHRVLREVLAEAWSEQIDATIARLKQPDEELKAELDRAAESLDHPLSLWARTRERQGAALAAEWRTLRDQREARRSQDQAWRGYAYPLRWSFSEADAAQQTRDFVRHGQGMGVGPGPAGQWVPTLEGDRVVSSLRVAGESSDGISSKDGAVLASPDFVVDFDELWVAVSARGGARVRFVVRNYPRVIGLLYVGQNPDSDDPVWVRWDMRYWKGEEVHVEIATAGDLPVEARGDAGRSWFQAVEIVGRNADQPEPVLSFDAFPNLELPSSNESELTQEAVAEHYARTLQDAIAAWRSNSASSEQATLLQRWLRYGLFSDSLSAVPEAAEPLNRWREVERDIREAVRTPGIVQARPQDRPLWTRGDPKRPEDLVARGWLEAFGGREYPSESPGRLELAEDIVASPLFARVMANRLWHYVFGRGLVATCDNFGRLGEEPSHPELLDWLASELREGVAAADGAREPWRVKALLRELVRSRAFRVSSVHPDPRVETLDPNGVLGASFRVRRLEAEAIRDGILSVAGLLERTPFGPGVPGTTPRRSVYVRVQRNDLDPFLTAFDAPTPFSTQGVRDATNVPAQSLTLLNDPTIRSWAEAWGVRLAAQASVEGRESVVRQMFREALGREATSAELERAIAFLDTCGELREQAATDLRNLMAAAERAERRLATIEQPIRAKLESSTTPADASRAPAATLAWDFEEDANEKELGIAGRLEGDARLAGGALVVSGNGWVTSDPLPMPLKARSLEAWVRIEDLAQQGGGVMTLETMDGNLFDSIVLGELEQGRWLAGSNFLARTAPFGGPSETPHEVVHLLWVYAEDGTITAYRDGERYGSPIRQGPLLEHTTGQARIAFGLRHSPAGGNRLLRGEIVSAALFDRALNADEAAARFELGSQVVTRRQILAAMDSETHAAWQLAWAEVEATRLRVEALQQSLRNVQTGEAADWADLAHATLNLKEFVYLD